MKLIVGLGNPGKKYEKTRHNIGFIIADALIHHFNLPDTRTKFQGEVTDGTINNHKVIILKPTTYMNNSGQSVKEATQFYKIPPEDTIVIHDELDLKENQIRVKIGGGHGGHNGLRDIDNQIGKNYLRVRYGISHPGDKDMVTNYVLNNFTNGEWNTLQPCIEDFLTAFPLILEEKPEDFMTKYALLQNPPIHNKKTSTENIETEKE